MAAVLAVEKVVVAMAAVKEGEGKVVERAAVAMVMEVANIPRLELVEKVGERADAGILRISRTGYTAY